MVLDPLGHAVSHGDARVLLTPIEFRLLARLTREQGTVVPRGALVAAGWPDGARVHPNTMDAYMVRLRQKLREVGAPVAIRTVRGTGHVLE
jgi:two-component system response regulator MprA